MIQIKPFVANDGEYAAFFALMDAVWPDERVDPDSFRHFDASWDKRYFFCRLLAVAEGQVVGCATGLESWWLAQEGAYYLSILVHPDWRRQTIGSQLYDRLRGEIQATGQPARQFTAETRTDQSGGLAFLARHGYVEDHRYPRSELQLANLSRADLAASERRLAEQGIVIESLSTLMAAHPDWREQLYELEWIFQQDEPTSDKQNKMSYEDWCQRRLDNPLFLPEGWFVAVSEGRFVGLSCLWPSKRIPERMNTGWTGVDRPFRRRGLATAMKLRAAAFAQARGASHIRTDNHEENWMYQINLRLGFQPLPAFVTFRKDLLAAI